MRRISGLGQWTICCEPVRTGGGMSTPCLASDQQEREGAPSELTDRIAFGLGNLWAVCFHLGMKA